MLFYSIIRPIARIALHIYFKKIYLSNVDKIPLDKPIILAVNHPTAFIEPCILATCLPFDLHFLVRGDFFKKRFYAKLLRSLHMIPIFRLKDGGYHVIKNNFNTLDIAQKAVLNYNAVMILAEGTTKHEKRLRPLKKGAARLAIGSLLKSKGNADICIIPIGVNYTDSDQFRSEAMLEVGDPIMVKPYYESALKNTPLVINEITMVIESRLKEKVIHFDSENVEILIESLFRMRRNVNPRPNFPIRSTFGGRLKNEIAIASIINEMSDDDKIELSKSVFEYSETLEKHDVSDFGILHLKKSNILDTVAVVIGFLPAFVGKLINFMPGYFAHVLASQKVKSIEFRASVKISIAIVLFLLYYLIVFLVFGIGFKFWFVGFFPFLGYFSLIYFEFLGNYWMRIKAKKLDNKTLQSLLDMRSRIFDNL